MPESMTSMRKKAEMLAPTAVRSVKRFMGRRAASFLLTCHSQPTKSTRTTPKTTSSAICGYARREGGRQCRCLQEIARNDQSWTNDRRSVPRLRDSTLLQSEDKTRRDSKDEDRSNPVEREEPPKGRLGGQAGSLLFRFELSKSLGSARSDKEDDGHKSDASDGQVQVEAPSPRRMLGENAAEEGADLEVGARKRVREARISFRRKEELQHATRTTLETAKTAPNPPNMAGRFWRGTISAMMERTPEERGEGEGDLRSAPYNGHPLPLPHPPYYLLTNIPAAPTPANARPKIRTLAELATPQTREPSSKRATATMKTHFVAKKRRT